MKSQNINLSPNIGTFLSSEVFGSYLCSGLSLLNEMAKEKICGIYKITSPSKKVYIGQSIDCLFRKNHYRLLHCKGQQRIYNSIKKHGWDKHKFEILQQCSREELNELEKYYVDLYQTFNSKFGLNLRDGGGAKGKTSDETKKRLRELICSDESRKKMSEARKGCVFTEEHKLNLSSSLKGRKTWNKGMPATEKEKARLRTLRLNVPMPDVAKVKLRNHWAKEKGIAVLQYDLDGNFLNEYHSFREAERCSGVPLNTIRHATNEGRIIFHKKRKFIWKKK